MRNFFFLEKCVEQGTFSLEKCIEEETHLYNIIFREVY